MNKYDFIKELIENKKININQRERILELTAKEIRCNGKLEERINKIENIIFKNINPKKTENQIKPVFKKADTIKTTLPKYIDPVRLYVFLLKYNQNRILKSTCHDIDSNELRIINEYCKTNTYNFKKHLAKIIETYNEHEHSYFAPHQVKSLFRGYLTGKGYDGKELKQGWSSDKIKINWSHIDLLSWAEGNPGFPPNPNDGLKEKFENTGFEFKRLESNITGNIIQNFTDLVIHFKHLFHIRRDNSLRDIIEKRNKIQGWNENIEFVITDDDFPKNIELFTDIDKLVQSYKKLIELIIEESIKQNKNQKPKIKLSLIEKKNSIELSIHHLNSIYGKTIQNTLDRMGSTYSNLITNQINGLCNLYLLADFGGKHFAKINLWDGNSIKEERLSSLIGVEHILEFRKI